MREPVDVLVVGSGPSAVHASWPLVEAGWRVRMLDVGHRDDRYEKLVPHQDFLTARASDPEQHRYFLGDQWEGVGFGGIGTGPQLTPPRQHVVRDIARLTPVASDSFAPLESFALGGLGAAWGAGCQPFTEEDLAGMPISLNDLAPHHALVAERIGVSGPGRDLGPFFGELPTALPPLDSDRNARSILARYRARKERFQRDGFVLDLPPLAILSRPHRGREASAYQDMDFWSDGGRSVYRPRWTLEELQRFPNFDYCGRRFVREFAEDDGTVRLNVEPLDGGESEGHVGSALLLAAGTLGSARIVLRSLGQWGVRVPLVCNPHVYVPMLNLNHLGAPGDDRRHSMAQLCAVLRGAEGQPDTVVFVYSYRSLLTFKLVRESPLPVRESLAVFRELLPSLAVAIFGHADSPSPAKGRTLRQRHASPDVLEVDYASSAEELRRHDEIERRLVRNFRRLRCLCLRRVHPKAGASIHYAGTFPMTRDDRPLTTDVDGRLRGTRHVYLADGSVFPSLPSKGLTFTMMANANRVGAGLAQALRHG